MILFSTTVLPAVLYSYECESWSITRKEFENRVLKRIFGPRREEITGGWRKVFIEELHDL
jgi:hypothetical protein